MVSRKTQRHTKHTWDCVWIAFVCMLRTTTMGEMHCIMGKDYRCRAKHPLNYMNRNYVVKTAIHSECL